MDIISITFKPFNLEISKVRTVNTPCNTNRIIACQNKKWEKRCKVDTFNDGSTWLNIMSARLIPAITPSALAINVASASTSEGIVAKQDTSPEGVSKQLAYSCTNRCASVENENSFA